MAAIEYLADRMKILEPLRTLLFSHSVLSKQSILERGLYAAIVDDHHFYNEEGLAFVNACKNLDARSINWCRTADLLDLSITPDIHAIDCTYEALLSRYLEFDKSIPYWDHLLFLENLNAFVLHTAHDHIIYVGSESFVNESTQRKNQFHDGWLAVIGQAFSDPELITEFGLRKENEGNN